MPRRMTVACGLAVIAMALTGCATALIPPTYTPDELKAICERHNGWWHPNDLIAGYCEAFP